MAWLARRTWQDELRDALAQQARYLSREMRGLGRTAGHYGHELQHGAADVGDALLHGGAVAARRLGREAKRAGRAVAKDPAPALAATIAAICIISLVASRR